MDRPAFSEVNTSRWVGS